MSDSSSNTSRLTRDTQAFVDTLAAQNNPPLYTLSPVEARKVLSNLQAGPVHKRPVDIKDMELPVGPTGSVSIRIVRPVGETGTMPVIFYFHGGGWILGDKDTHDRLVRELACEANATVVFPNYTPSPAAKYPVPIEQAYAAMTHVVEHAETFGIDPARIAVVGDSVGGNMATVMALLAKDRNGPDIAYQVLLYPVTDANFATESYNEFAEGPWLTRKAMQWFWDAYAPEESQRADITASPLRGTTKDLSGLPPALIITAENDVLRDEGEMYARKLIEAGVVVTCVRYNGTHHDFMMLNALADTAPARAATAQVASVLKKVLH